MKDDSPRALSSDALPARAHLILFALWILAALALACSTRWDMIPTLAICSAFFLLGLMSDYLFGRRAEPAWETFNTQKEVDVSHWNTEQKKLLSGLIQKYDANKDASLDEKERRSIGADDKQSAARSGLSGSWWASICYAVVPNWQNFWLADALEGQKTIPWSYVGQALVYVVGYLGASLAIALLLFEDRELS